MAFVNTVGLRRSYEYIRLCEKLRDGFGNPEGIEQFIIEEKRAVRAYHRRQNQPKDRRIISGDYEGYIELIELPDCIESYDEAVEYFDEYERIPAWSSPYDCTGRTFTRWGKVFCRNGRYMAYHAVGRDV